MTSSNKPLADFLMTQDFVKLKEEAIEMKRKAQADAIAARKQAEEDQIKAAAEKKITEADLTDAENRGYEKGLQEGTLQTKKKMQEEYASHMQELEDKLVSHTEISRKYTALLMQESILATKSIVEALLDDVSTRYPQDMLKKVIERALERCEKKAALTLYIHPTSQIYIANIAKDLLKDKEHNIEEDNNLTPGQCRIEWGSSGVDSSMERMHEDLQNLLDGFRQGIHPNKVELPPLEEEPMPEKNVAEELVAEENPSEEHAVESSTESTSETSVEPENLEAATEVNEPLEEIIEGIDNEFAEKSEQIKEEAPEKETT